jgi:hypothetical protein
MEIVAELEQRGVPCWIAPRDLRPGHPFDDEIAEAIDGCRAMLLIFSERCNGNKYIRREVTVAGESNKIIIPFRIEDAQPKGGLRVRLSDLHRIDGFVSRESAIDELVRALLAPEQEHRDQPETTDAVAVVFTSQNLSETMSNPRYSDDLTKLDGVYDLKAIINEGTIIVVVGKSIPAELLDRPTAELLRDQIDRRGVSESPFRRAIVLTDEAWYAEASDIAMNPVISIGGPRTNKLTMEFDEWQAPEGSHQGKFQLEGGNKAHTGFFRPNQKGLPQVGVWGHSGHTTREAVEIYVKSARGLAEFLTVAWK